MYIENIGKKFNKWLVLDLFTFKSRSHYKIQCECGLETKVPAYRVVNNLTSSCKFCASRKHGGYKTTTHNSWSSARNRCNNLSNKDYKHYGARGIKMCTRWNKFENFLADMGQRPIGLTLDRINNDGDYDPTNCRWATRSQQNSNQRKRIKYVKELPLSSLN